MMPSYKLSPSQEEISAVIENSLKDFIKSINQKEWIGRENEAVNAFAFSYLLKNVREKSVLFDYGQIGIEVAIPQLKHDGKESGSKKQVRKDLIIWKKPLMTSSHDLF